MRRESVEKDKVRRTISDEMNLGEFPLATVSDRVPSGVDTLVYEDDIKHPVTGEPYTRKLTVRGQAPFGLPTAKDEELLMGCLKATSEAGFKSRRVEVTPSEFLRGIRWRTDGPAYKRWKKGMDRWSTVSVVSEDAYWHRGKKQPVRDMLGVIDRWQASGTDRVTGLPERAFFVWGDFMWESFKAGNLRNIDFDFWLGLESAASRRLFRFLDKRFYRQTKLPFPLKEFAVNKIGMSKKNSNGQIKQTLDQAHTELEAKRFCRAEYVGHGKEATVVYHSLKAKEEADEEPLVQALKQRGVRGIKKLIHGKDRTRIERAIKNFDHRNRMGENRKGGWLHNDIAAETPYAFRDDYVTDEELATEAAKKKRAEEEAARRRSSIVSSSDKARNEQKAAFENYFDALSETEQREFREAAVAQSTAYSQVLRKGDPLHDGNYAVFLEAAMVEHWRRVSKGVLAA